MKQNNTLQARFSLMLADDDPDDRYIFVLAVNELKMDVNLHAVCNGQETLRYLSESKTLPNMLFMDINMPLLGGIDCLKNIRKIPEYNSICVAIYSTSCTEAEIAETFRSGGNLYIKKPHDYERLKQILLKTVNNFDCPDPALKTVLLD